MSDPLVLTLPWRTGRRVGRTVYAQFSKDPAGTDVLIGVMDTPELADEAVASHNAVLAMRPAPAGGGRV